jgi:hypothetical protein
LCLLNPVILVVSGLSDVLGAIGRNLLSYLVHMHGRLRSLGQGQVHVGPIPWEVLPQSPCQPLPSGSGEGGGDEVRGFLFSGLSLRLRKPKQKASANGKVKNHRRPLFRVYKGPGEIHPKHRPNPSRNSNSKAKWFFCSSNDSRTRNRCPANRPSHRINSLAGQATPLAVEAGTVSPPT